MLGTGVAVRDRTRAAGTLDRVVSRDGVSSFGTSSLVRTGYLLISGQASQRSMLSTVEMICLRTLPYEKLLLTDTRRLSRADILAAEVLLVFVFAAMI